MHNQRSDEIVILEIFSTIDSVVILYSSYLKINPSSEFEKVYGVKIQFLLLRLSPLLKSSVLDDHLEKLTKHLSKLS